MDPLDALQVCAIGAFLGLLLGVPLGRLSLLIQWRASWRRQYLRQLTHARQGREVARRHLGVEVEHAGQYVQHDRVRAGVCQLEPPESFARVRS